MLAFDLSFQKWKYSEWLQQLKVMGERCKLGVWDQNAIQMEENSLQFNTFWSKI